MTIEQVFSVVVLIVSVMIHEVAHGYAALYLGDGTAKYANRLTLNPLRHIDPMGSVVLPLIMIMTGSGVVFGWAKPVPVNPYNLRGRHGEAIVAVAGPLSNLTIAILFSLIIRFVPHLSVSFMEASVSIIIVNLVLAVFNMVPIPPLDGSKVLFSFLPESLRHIQEWLEKYGFFLLLIFIFFFWNTLSPVIAFLFKLLVGLPFV